MNYTIKIFKKTHNDNNMYKLKVDDIFLGFDRSLEKCVEDIQPYDVLCKHFKNQYVEWDNNYLIFEFEVNTLEKHKVLNTILNLIPEEFL